jgi:hypothetical protein
MPLLLSFLCFLVVLACHVVAGPTAPPGAVPLDILHYQLTDPFQSSGNDVLLSIDVATNCPQNVIVYVTIAGNGQNGVGGTPQFYGTHFDSFFVGDSLFAPPAPSANIEFFPTGTSGFPVGDSLLIFSNIQHYVLALDANNQQEVDSNNAFLYYRFVVEIPTSELPADFQVHGGGIPLILTTQNAFNAYLTSTDCGQSTVNQDPIFSGFQGQDFQFHGLPDEHFNLVSSPDVQLNSHFVYLSSGKCDYNDTECYTHPGTYMDVLGLSILDSHVKLVAGTHEAGLRIWLNDQEIRRGTHIKAFTNTSAYIKYRQNGRVEIHTEIMNFDIANSDMFMNLRVALNNHQLLRVGGIHHTVTDHAICKANTETSNYQLIEQTVAAKYPVTTPLHGLIGQTWRNVKVCSKDWMGTVQDYITSDLFASDYHYNYFNW